MGSATEGPTGPVLDLPVWVYAIVLMAVAGIEELLFLDVLEGWPYVIVRVVNVMSLAFLGFGGYVRRALSSGSSGGAS